MKPAAIFRFYIAALLITIGCWLILTGFSGFGTGMLFAAAALFSMPRSELHSPIPRRELWTLLGFLVLFIAASAACKYLIPISAAKAAERVFQYPTVVFPLWLLMMWGVHRQWKRQSSESEV